MSLLSRQLAAHRVNNPLPPPADAKKSRPTILFTSAQAANLDAREILDLGRNAYAKLLQDAPEFQAFQDLFGTVLGSDPKSEHHLLPQSEKLRVDALCRDFLGQLSPYYSDEPAVHVLEFLIQRYQVHIVSADALLSSLLPHHETKLFSTVIRLVMAQHAALTGNSRWFFLQRFADAPNGVPRSAFVQAACKDISLMDAVASVSAKTSPKFFAAFCLETLQMASVNASPAALDAVVSITSRNVVDLLKSPNALERNLAALVISGLARTVTLAPEACDAFLMLLAKRAAKLDNQDRGDLVKCAIMLYEWQVAQRGVQVLANRWDKFAQVFEPSFPTAVRIESQQQKCCLLVDELIKFSVQQAQPERFFPVLKWNETIYFDRAVRVLEQILSMDADAQEGAWAPVLQQLSLEQPNAYELQNVRNGGGNDHIVGLKMSFHTSEACFLALRSPNRMIRQAALAHLERDAEYLPEVTASVVANWADAFLETGEGQDDLARLLKLFIAAAATGGGEMDQDLASTLKRVMKKCPGQKDDDELALVVVEALKADLPFLASVHYNSATAPEVRALCDKLLKKTWMHHLVKEDFAACGKHLDKLQDEEAVRQAVEEIYSFAPELALRLLESSKRAPPRLVLELVERGNAKAVPANAKLVAQNAIKELGLEALVLRLLQTSNEAWPQAYPILIEALLLAGADAAQTLLWGPALSTLPEHNTVPGVMRALRLLACQKTQSAPAANWVNLLGALRCAESSQVRLLANQVLSTVLKPAHPLHGAFAGREEELERDAKTLDRIVASDKAVRAALIQAAANVNSTEQVTRCIVELLGDRALARQVLLLWLPKTGPSMSSEMARSAFACYSEKSAAAGEEAATAGVEELAILELGLKHAPQLTLDWAVNFVAWPLDGIAAKISIFDLLFALVLREDQDPRVVSLALQFLAQHVLLFDEAEICKRLQKVATTKAAGGGVTSANAREIQLLVECASTYGFSHPSIFKELFRLLPLSREFGVLEQALLVALERNVARLSNAGDFHKLLVGEMRDASTVPGRTMARRAFCRASPTTEAYTLAFATVDEFPLFCDLEQALCSNSPEVAANDALIDALALRCFKFLPFPDHHHMLARIAKWGGKQYVSRLIAQWISFQHTSSRNAVLADCVFIASQFDSAKQTDVLIQLMAHKHCLDFVAHHLGSKVFMKALLASVDETKSVQFIQLFELLLEQLVALDEEEDEGNKLVEQAHLETALDRLSVLLSIHVFVPVMAETLAERQPVKIRNLALRVLKLKIAEEHRDWTKEEVKYVMEFVYALISWLSPAAQQQTNNHATTVLALNAFATALAQSHPHVFAKAVPVLSAMLDANKTDVERGAVLLCLGTICKSIGTHALPYLNALVPKMIACCSSSTSNNNNNVLRGAAFHALRDIVESGLAINLADLVKLVMLESTSEEMDALIETLGNVMEPRTGVAVCLEVLRKNAGNSAESGLMALLDRIVSRITPTDMPALQELTDLCNECCRKASASNHDQVVAVVIKVALLLSEKKLKTVLLSLVALAERKDDAGCGADVVLDVLRGLVNKCGSLVLPIMPITFMLDSLNQALDADSEEAAAAHPTPSKKQKLILAQPAAVNLETALGAMGECLVHAIGTKFVDMSLFESLLSALVRALERADTETSQAFVDPAMASLALCSLSQPSVNAMLQTLHHAITRLVKSTNARIRLNALSCIKTLFERVGDDYLALMPDTLPFLAELLEDREEQIRVLAQKLALVLKDLSGEDIAEFLK